MSPPARTHEVGRAAGDATDPERACLRCGLPDGGSPACPRCSMPWVSGVPAVTDVLPPGVRAARWPRRVAAYALDLLPLAALAGAAALGPSWWRWLAVLVAAAYLAASATTLTTTGRTCGRRLLGLRSVDLEVGEPVGGRRLLHRLAAGRRPGLLLADLRAGVDPLELPLPSSADLRARRRAARRDDPTTASLTAGERALLAYASPLLPVQTRVSEPGARVGLLLGDGRRHDVDQTLLLGRNPVDVSGEGATLVSWPDLSRRLAKTHLRVEWREGLLWVTDLHSASGTSLVGPDGVRRPLAPGVRAAAPIGATIECGGRSVRVVRGG